MQARRDWEAGLSAERGAGRGGSRAAFIGTDLEPGNLADGNIISLPSPDLAAQPRKQCFGACALPERAELNSPFA